MTVTKRWQSRGRAALTSDRLWVGEAGGQLERFARRREGEIVPIAVAVGKPGGVAFLDALPSDERTATELAAALLDSGNLHPLIARLKGWGGRTRTRARDALRILVELDMDLLVQITLDGLISVYLADPGLAHQPRRVVRSEETTED
jgi:hypothetical protein